MDLRCRVEGSGTDCGNRAGRLRQGNLHERRKGVCSLDQARSPPSVPPACAFLDSMYSSISPLVSTATGPTRASRGLMWLRGAPSWAP